jgi:catechol 2,3-dioxygenase-like lactoylglutathione lyase family enzyme
MFNQIDYVMVTVSDMSRSVQFYRDKLGLRPRFESPEWTEFETGTTVLALHGGGKPATISHDPKAGTASIGFYVDNLDDKFNELKEKGVTFIMPPTDRAEERIKLAVCLDPDGLPISIAERKQ